MGVKVVQLILIKSGMQMGGGRWEMGGERWEIDSRVGTAHQLCFRHNISYK